MILEITRDTDVRGFQETNGYKGIRSIDQHSRICKIN